MVKVFSTPPIRRNTTGKHLVFPCKVWHSRWGFLFFWLKLFQIFSSFREKYDFSPQVRTEPRKCNMLFSHFALSLPLQRHIAQLLYFLGSSLCGIIKWPYVMYFCRSAWHMFKMPWKQTQPTPFQCQFQEYSLFLQLSPTVNLTFTPTSWRVICSNRKGSGFFL